MFGPELARRDGLEELGDVALGVFGLLRDGIARLQAAGLLRRDDAGRLAISAWATLHGLVMLSLDGQTEVTGVSVDALTDSAIALLLEGMGATGTARRGRGR